MNCIVTKSSYTKNEDFSGADAVFESLEDGGVSLGMLSDLVTRKTTTAAA